MLEQDASAFAVVMATGIVAVGARLEGLPILGDALAAAAGAAWLVLACVAGRAALRPGSRPTLKSFAVVAGTAVLGAYTVVVDLDRIGLALWLLALALWLLLALRPPRLGTLSGGTLLLVVGTESLAVLAALLSRQHEAPLLDGAAAAWALGLLLYPVVVGVVLVALARERRFRADHWIVMGALAIASLACAELLLAARELDALGGLRTALPYLDLATWALATALIPSIVALELWQRDLRYEMSRWGCVFPLGMYGVASHAVGTAESIPALHDLGTAFFAIALAAWTATTVGMAWTARRRHMPIA